MKLSDLHSMTSLQVFEFVKTHLLNQNKRSLLSYRNQCAYRGDETKLMCAAGCLISDEEYQLTWENNSWSSLVMKGIVPNAHFKLIDRLQEIHDVYEPFLWKQKLDELEITVRSGQYE